MPAVSPTLTTPQEQSVPDLVQTAWRTEGRIKSLEIGLAPSMVDLRDMRKEIKEIATELHETRIEVLAFAHEQHESQQDVRILGFDLRHVKTEVHALTHEQRRLHTKVDAVDAKVDGVEVILGAIVNHFGIAVPNPNPNPDPDPQDGDQAEDAAALR
jgi:septal ring factor EnvC (AmiA/AmiB activator)